MVLMNSDEFEFVYSRLNSAKDVELLHGRMSLPQDMLFNVLAKKITRNAIRNFYRVKAKSDSLVQRWKKGESFVQIADSLDFPPVLLAGFILEKAGYNKKQIREMLRDNSIAPDKRIGAELKEACEQDFIYSPCSTENQAKNGRGAEVGINEWLDKNKIEYFTQQDLIELGSKRTPDFLLKKPMIIKGREINWIESKASFGDDRELSKDYKKQLSDYKKYFKEGAVVYWYGYVTDNSFNEQVLVLTKEDFA